MKNRKFLVDMTAKNECELPRKNDIKVGVGAGMDIVLPIGVVNKKVREIAESRLSGHECTLHKGDGTVLVERVDRRIYIDNKLIKKGETGAVSSNVTVHIGGGYPIKVVTRFI
ncbi:MAG: hypothetical protein ABIE22_04680 [archaeon]